MKRGSGAGVRSAPAPRHSIKPHRYQADGPLCARCPLPKGNPVHDEQAIAEAEALAHDGQVEHQRRLGER